MNAIATRQTNRAVQRRTALGMALLIGYLHASVASTQTVVSIAVSPVIRVSGTDASSVGITAIVAASRLNDGTLAVADRFGRVYYFDKSGAFARSAGQPGRGPGEFAQVTWAGNCGGDTLVVWDQISRRFSAIASGGSVVRQSGPSVPLGQSAAFSTLACGRGGVVVAQTRGAPPMALSPSTPTTFRPSAAVLLGTNLWAFTRFVDSVPASEIVVMGGGGAPRPLGKETALAVGRTHVYVGTGDSARIDVYSLDGRRMTAIRVQSAERRPTAEEHRDAVDALLSDAPRSAVSRIRRILDAVPPVTSVPPYRRIFADTGDRIWVEVSPAGRVPIALQLYDQSGKLRGNMRVALAAVHEVYAGYVVGTVADGNGEIGLAVYRYTIGP